MKILHVITTLDVGGAEMHVLAQTKGQTARGHQVRVAYIKGLGTLEPDFQAAGAEQVVNLGRAWQAPLRLGKHLRWADVAHSHLLKADGLAALTALITGCRKRLVAAKHNDEQVLRRPLVSLAHGWLGRVPRRTIVLSDHVGRFIAHHGRVPLERQTRIYYGLDLAPFDHAAAAGLGARAATRASLGLSEQDIVLTCIARFAPQKAHDVLLRAFARLPTAVRGARLRLLLVGDDPYAGARLTCEQLARELGLLDRVVFAGIRRDIPQVLHASDVFVMASLWEGLGLVYLESMASRLPIVASRVSAVPEVIEDQVTGLLVRPGNVEELSAALERLAADSSLRQRLGLAGRKRVEQRFGLERMIEETLSVYTAL